MRTRDSLNRDSHGIANGNLLVAVRDRDPLDAIMSPRIYRESTVGRVRIPGRGHLDGVTPKSVRIAVPFVSAIENDFYASKGILGISIL
jgi:hypothetical protein